MPSSTRTLSVALACVLAAALHVGCSSSDAADAGGGGDATIGSDASVRLDAAPINADAAPTGDDAEVGDAIQPHPDAAPVGDDAEVGDAVQPHDAAPTTDATVILDAAAPDAAPGAPDAGFANACENVGGICLGTAANCTGGMGTVLPAGAPGCIFSDGPGVCCAPPVGTSEGPTCAQYGGLCAPIAGCNFVEGAFAPPSCGFPGVVCCVPESQCGPETQVCCEPGGQTTFRTSCDRGTWTCIIPGTQLMPPGACP